MEDTYERERERKREGNEERDKGALRETESAVAL